MKNKSTTIKLNIETKKRIDHLRLYPRETYDETIQRLLELMNMTRSSPEKARAKLFALDKQRKHNFKLTSSSQIEDE